MDTGTSSAHSANIRIDYAQGIDEAMDDLVSLGHRRIAFITGPPTWSRCSYGWRYASAALKALWIVRLAIYLEKGDHRIQGARSP